MSTATEEPTSDLKALEAAIGRVASTATRGLRPGQLTERALVMERLRTQLESACLATLREVDTSASWAATDPGAVNPKCWLANHTGQARRVAGSRLNLARHLDRMPLAAAALAAGAITESHARTLAWCAGARTAALFAEHEARLVDLARTHTADELAVLVRYWLQAADPDGSKPRDGSGEEVFLSQTLDQWVLKGSFDEHLGAELATALNDKCDQLFRQEQRLAETDPDDPTVGRSAAARRAAALAELVGLGAAAPESTIQRARRSPSTSTTTPSARCWPDTRTPTGAGMAAARSSRSTAPKDGIRPSTCARPTTARWSPPSWPTCSCATPTSAGR